MPVYTGKKIFAAQCHALHNNIRTEGALSLLIMRARFSIFHLEKWKLLSRISIKKSSSVEAVGISRQVFSVLWVQSHTRKPCDNRWKSCQRAAESHEFQKKWKFCTFVTFLDSKKRPRVCVETREKRCTSLYFQVTFEKNMWHFLKTISLSIRVPFWKKMKRRIRILWCGTSRSPSRWQGRTGKIRYEK